MILNKKSTPDNTISTTSNNRIMLKMVTSYSIFLLVIMVLSIFLYVSTKQNARNRFLQQSQTLLQNSIQVVDKDLQIMEIFARQLLQNPDFWTMAASDNIIDSDFRSSSRSLKNYLSTNILPDTLLPLQDYYIYFENTSQILSPNVFTARNMFYNGIKKYEAEAYDSWAALLTDTDSRWKMISMEPWHKTPQNHYYLYIIDFDELTYRSSDATMNFIIDGKKFSEVFTDVHFYEDSYILCCNDDAEIMFTLDAPDSGSKTTESVNHDAALLSSLTFTNNSSHYNEGGINMLVNRQYSAENGWTYYLVQPESAAYIELAGLLLFYQFCIIAGLIVGVSLVYFLSRKNVAPIVELGAELQVANEEKSQLQEVVDKQKPIIVNSYISRLFGGSISSEDEMLYIRDYLGLPQEALAYNVAYVVAYNNSENAGTAAPGASNGISPEDFEDIMQTTMRDYFGEPFYCYSPADRTYAILLAHKAEDADSLVMKVQEIVVHLHEYLLDHYGIWMFAGVGHTTNSLMNVWEAYEQAAEAVSYTTKNYIFFPYEIIKKDSNAFYYPPEISTKLIHFITSGNKSQVLELFGLIHKENIEERSLPIKLLQYLMQDIRNTLLKARFSLPTGTDKDVTNALDERFNEHLSFKLCEDLALTLCDLFQSGSKDLGLAATIEKYILQNYKDPSLCLNKISDEFQISESYFSHMFKEKTGVNFSVYLENTRIAEAARLIRETDVNLSELYLEIGYNNPATFRRAFKKIYGVTPSAMRESAGNR